MECKLVSFCLNVPYTIYGFRSTLFMRQRYTVRRKAATVSRLVMMGVQMNRRDKVEQQLSEAERQVENDQLFRKEENTPMRGPHAVRGRFADQFAEETMALGAGSNMMAPRREGIWSLVPYVAVCAALGASMYVVGKMFRKRQLRLVKEFGEAMVYYGDTVDSKRDIVNEYKWKLGTGILGGSMFKSFLKTLILEKPIGPLAISDAAVVKATLRIGDAKTARLIGEVGKSLTKEPSVLGKLLFLSDRLLQPELVREAHLLPLFPYGEGTVRELQRNMLERCYRELVSKAIDENGLESPPMKEANVLRLPPNEAQCIFDSVLVSRIKEKESKAAAVEAVEAEDAGKPNVADLDYPARSAEPAKITANAYQCTECGYTMFPAAGREFKFYGDDFVCPTCGSDKNKFVNLSDG